jgi:N-acetyl-anhydromuramyl-L-alanine amidase AmpD
MSTNGWYPKAIKLPISTAEYWTQRTQPILGICAHVTDGYDSRNLLQNANNGSSVHFLVRDEDGVGVVYQFMPVEWAAWGNGPVSPNNPYTPAWLQELIDQGVNPNMCTVSIEHERKWPFTTMPSEPMTQATIELQNWLCDNYPTIKRDRDHVIGHYQIDALTRANCPGGPGGLLFPFDRIVAVLQEHEVSRYFPETGHSIGHAFLEFFDAHGGIAQFGYPLTEERAGTDGDWQGTEQVFERAVFQYHTDVEPPQVMLRNIGAEWLATHG